MTDPKKNPKDELLEDLKYSRHDRAKTHDHRGILDGIMGNEDTVMQAPEDWPPPPEENNEKSSKG